MLHRIAAQQRLSLTYDQGREMAAHQKLVDGEKEPSIIYCGMEDSFGFSWGFREPVSGMYNGAVSSPKCKKCSVMLLKVERIRCKQLSGALEAERFARPSV